MRSPGYLLLLTVSLLLAASHGARAQVQEKKLFDRLNLSQEQMMKMEYDTRKSTLGDRSVGAKGTNAKEFAGTRTFDAQTFVSKSYTGTKQSWFSSLFFHSSKTALTKGKYEIPNAGKQYATTNVGVKEAREGSKEMQTLAFLPGETRYLKRDHFDATPRTAGPQGEIPVGWQGKLHEMTVDDIRDLLNKNK